MVSWRSRETVKLHSLASCHRTRHRRGARANHAVQSRIVSEPITVISVSDHGKVRAGGAHLSRGSSWTPADAAACGLSAIRLHRWTGRGCKLVTADRSCHRTCTDHHLD